MKLLFLGVGEAFDESIPNNSHIVLSDTKILLDCGYSVPGQLWGYNPDQSFLDAIYLSHGHADHYFGIPPLLVRMWEEKREKPLTLIFPKGMKKTVSELIDYGYQGISKRFAFEILFNEVNEGDTIRINEFKLSFAPTFHSKLNLAVRVNDGKHSVCYSGDGMFNNKTERLYRDADLVIHEAYLFERQIPGHANIRDLIEMAGRNNVKCLALTHLQRDYRKNDLESLKNELVREKVRILVPEALTEYTFDD